mgnify:CR=1 FL=1
MFTGIIETLGEVKKLEKEGGNLHITLSSNITQELKIDQSVAHNGVCLTVVKIAADQYDPKQNNVTIEKGSITIDGTSLTVVDSQKSSFSVAIIPYTYEHTRFGSYTIGTRVNLEFDVIGKYVSRLLEIRG